MAKKKTRNLYAEVAETVMEALDREIVPWRKPWSAGDDVHRNPASGTLYRGINPMLLEMSAQAQGFTDRRWVTFKGAQQLKGKVRKGEKGTMVVFFRMASIKEEVEGEQKTKLIPVLKHYVVFNVEQCDELDLPTDIEYDHFEPIERCEEVVAGYIAREHVGLKQGGDRAVYDIKWDKITTPEPETFVSDAAYYSTLFHELGHSTGHEMRLNRPDLMATDGFGSKSYAREELTAEMTAAMLCGHCDILPAQIDQTASYIAHWRQKISEDPRCVVIAAQRAQKAADLILDRQRAGAKEAEETKKAAAA